MNTRRLLLSFLLISLPTPFASSQVTWRTSHANPLLRTFQDVVRMRQAMEPCVIIDPRSGLLRMWFSSSTMSGTGNGVTTALADKDDHWFVLDRSPVLTGGSSGFDSRGILHAEVLHDGARYVMYYSGWNGSAIAIGLATSPDGYTWTKSDRNPVFERGSAGSWESVFVGFPQVTYDGTRYRMWYGGYDGAVSRTGFATSPDGLVWTRHPGNPILSPGPAGQWDDRGASVAGITRVGGRYFMLYRGNNAANANVALGLATSLDGIVWEKYGANPVFQPRSAWDGQQITGATLEFIGGEFVLWYSGSDGTSNWQIGKAAAPLVTAAWPPPPTGDLPASSPWLQTFPNPFNPSVTIRFTTRVDGPVRIDLVDVNGRIVTTVLEEWRAAGAHDVIWDGGNVASGTYFCTMRTGGELKTAKLMVAR